MGRIVGLEIKKKPKKVEADPKKVEADPEKEPKND